MEGKRGFIIAAVGSGAGKTTLALGMMAALRRRGVAVQPFKVGPDFIDPGHHARVAGRASRNLDGWMLSKSYNRNLFERMMRDAACAVVEGVMGLFDGFDAVSDAGSTAEMAKWLNLPVVLVVNAASMARSAAAVVRGVATFDQGLNFAGVIFNRVGSPSHLKLLKQAVDHYCHLPCFGGLPKNAEIAMPERHLGLVTAEEHPLPEKEIARLAEFVETHVDLDALLRSTAISIRESSSFSPLSRPAKVRIAVARDAAFCFYYPDNLELLEQAGAELVPFRPLKDARVPEGCHGIYLGGGYPEEFAEALSRNESMRISVREAGERGCPIYAECGGLMYLCREIVTFDGRTYPMVGLLPFATRMLRRFRALGYREVTFQSDGPLGPAGLVARGHEFHYSEVIGNKEGMCQDAYNVSGRKTHAPRQEGCRIYHTLASYIHLHFGSRPEIAQNWVDYCLRQNHPTP